MNASFVFISLNHFILSVLVVYSATCTNAPFEPVTLEISLGH